MVGVPHASTIPPLTGQDLKQTRPCVASEHRLCGGPHPRDLVCSHSLLGLGPSNSTIAPLP